MGSQKHKLFSVAVLLTWSIRYALCVEIHYGDYNFSTYMVGDSPIIILSQHGGHIKPDEMIPDRMDGCWNGTHCLWDHSCNLTWPRDRDECEKATRKDSYTKRIAMCLKETLSKIPLSTKYPTYYTTPHLVINELSRTKLDPNREIDEAAQHNIYAQNAFNEIHFKWMSMAKNSTIIQQKCNFGLVIDVHGQRKNDYVNLGYNLRTSDLQKNDAGLGHYIYRTSMKHLIKTVTKCKSKRIYNNDYICPNNYTMSDIIRGDKSLGTMLYSKWDEHGLHHSYMTTPSELKPYLEDGSGAFCGGTTYAIDIHGSRHGGIVDFFQLEINREIRINKTLRNLFCHDFSNALIIFMQQWYDVNKCFEITTTTGTINILTTTSILVNIFIGFLLLLFSGFIMYDFMNKNKYRTYKTVKVYIDTDVTDTDISAVYDSEQ